VPQCRCYPAMSGGDESCFHGHRRWKESAQGSSREGPRSRTVTRRRASARFVWMRHATSVQPAAIKQLASPDRMRGPDIETSLRLLHASCSADRISVEGRKRAGDVVGLANESDLVLVGRRRTSSGFSAPLNADARRLLRRSRTPLLVVGGKPKGPYRRVVVATDLETDITPALAWTRRIAPQATVTLLHVHRGLFEGKLQWAGVPDEQIMNHRLAAQHQAALGMKALVERHDTKAISRALLPSSASIWHTSARLTNPAATVDTNSVVCRFRLLFICQCPAKILSRTTFCRTKRTLMGCRWSEVQILSPRPEPPKAAAMRLFLFSIPHRRIRLYLAFVSNSRQENDPPAEYSLALPHGAPRAAARTIRRAMPIFLLTPKNLEASDWAMTTCREPVLVEAADEQGARTRAALRYSLAPRNAAGHRIGAFAWRMESLVSARIVDAADPNLEFIAADHT